MHVSVQLWKWYLHSVYQKMKVVIIKVNTIWYFRKPKWTENSFHNFTEWHCGKRVHHLIMTNLSATVNRILTIWKEPEFLCLFLHLESNIYIPLFSENRSRISGHTTGCFFPLDIVVRPEIKRNWNYALVTCLNLYIHDFPVEGHIVGTEQCNHCFRTHPESKYDIVKRQCS